MLSNWVKFIFASVGWIKDFVMSFFALKANGNEFRGAIYDVSYIIAEISLNALAPPFSKVITRALIFFSK